LLPLRRENESYKQFLGLNTTSSQQKVKRYDPETGIIGIENDDRKINFSNVQYLHIGKKAGVTVAVNVFLCFSSIITCNCKL